MKFLKNFYNNYISVKLNEFSGFESELQINKPLFFVFLGIMAAAMIITYNNSFATLVLKKLTRVGAFGEENGKSLSDIGLGDSKAVKTLLKRKSGAIKSIILQKDEKKLSFEEYNELESAKKKLKNLSREEKKQKLSEINEKLSLTVNFETAEFYIPNDKKDASERFIADKSTTMLNGIVCCALLLVFYIVIAFAMPSILSFISRIITQ